jgi:hypothetical protein
LEIYINKEKLDFKLENEKNLREIIEEINKWLLSQGKVIEEIIINGQVYNDTIESLEKFSIDYAKRIDLSIIDIEVLVRNSLTEVKQYILKMLDVIKSKEEFDKKEIENIKDGIEWVLDIILKCDKIYKYSENIKDKEFDFNERVEKLKSFLEIINKYENSKKFNDLAKYLKGDFSQFLDKFLKYLDKLIDFSVGLPESRKISREKITRQLYNIINKLPDMIKLIDATVIELQSGSEKEAMENIDIIVGTLQSVVSLLQIINSTFSIDFNKLIFDDGTVEEFNNKLNSTLEEILNAFENRDIILLADLLGYELVPKIEKYVDVLKLIAKEINLDIN